MYDYFYYYFYHGFYAMYLASFVLIPMMVLEWLAPARKLHWPTVFFNLAYGPVFVAVAAMVLTPISSYLQPHLPENILAAAPEHWKYWQLGLAALAYVAAYDLLYYWLHCAQHRVPFLWRFHRFHHADPNLSASSSFRHHWLEDTFRYFIIAAPLIILFGSLPRFVPWLGLAMGGYGLFIHWNSALNLGIFNRVVVGPQYHRIHHSSAPEHHDKNFAIFFPVVDRLFGTQVLPVPGESPQTGVAGTRSANHPRQLLPLPPVTS